MASDRVVSDLMLLLWKEVLWLFLECLGQCASTYNLYAVECPKEIPAVRRALLLPFGEQADGPQGAGSAGAQQPAAWRASLLLVQKEPACVPDSEAFNSFIGVGFPVPELKGESEASEDDQADNVSNVALYVIGLHGSGDKISRYLQDWEEAKVAVSCPGALDMLCQELWKVERRRGWFGFLNKPVG